MDLEVTQTSGLREALASVPYWDIENCLHYSRDVSCREDQARPPTGHTPQVLAARHNTR